MSRTLDRWRGFIEEQPAAVAEARAVAAALLAAADVVEQRGADA